MLTSYDRDTIRPNALGNFYQLLQATAESPAMLFYLDNFQSVSPTANAGRNGNPDVSSRAAILCWMLCVVVILTGGPTLNSADRMKRERTVPIPSRHSRRHVAHK